MRSFSSKKTHTPRDAEICMRILPFGERLFVPQVGPDVRMLGVVQRGLETGALAQLADGSYAQVNGDIVQPLNPVQVETALRCAGVALEQVAPVVVAKPTVIVKRRRMIQSTCVDASR